MKKVNFWDVLAWIILVLILLWIILKVSGIINTPILIEYAPLFGAVYLAGWAMHKLDNAVDDIRSIKEFNKATIFEINKIKENCIKNHK
jgi:hypothetical protein